MAKSKLDTGSTPNGAGEASASTAALSQPSRRNAKKRTSKGLGLSDSDLINILMVDLNRVQERFGEVHFLRPDGDGEPGMIVFPIKLDICKVCGLIIPRGDVPLCEAHANKTPVLAG